VDDPRRIREPAERLRPDECDIDCLAGAGNRRVAREDLDEPLTASFAEPALRLNRLAEAQENRLVDKRLDAMVDNARDQEVDGRRTEVDGGADAFRTRRHSAVDQDEVDGPAERRRVDGLAARVGAAGLAAGFAELVLGFVLRAVFGLAAVAFGLAALVFGLAAVVAFGLAAVVAFGVAAAAAAGRVAAAAAAGRVAAAVFEDALDFAAAALLRRRVRADREAAAGRAWRFLSPCTSAPSSRTSAVTSASRTVRLSRFLSVACASLSRRRASSSRAAASANSSHSTWRTTAATGVIATGTSFAI
jgi:hypothetical protein